MSSKGTISVFFFGMQPHRMIRRKRRYFSKDKMACKWIHGELCLCGCGRRRMSGWGANASIPARMETSTMSQISRITIEIALCENSTNSIGEQYPSQHLSDVNRSEGPSRGAEAGGEGWLHSYGSKRSKWAKVWLIE